MGIYSILYVLNLQLDSRFLAHADLNGTSLHKGDLGPSERYFRWRKDQQWLWKESFSDLCIIEKIIGIKYKFLHYFVEKHRLGLELRSAL